MNFWPTLKKPIIGLSPMDGVTDAPFRFITAKYGKPAVVFTEFISVDGMYHTAEQIYRDFLYSEAERPVVAQVFGNEPELFFYAAIAVGELGFDGMDINMGCPAKTVAHRGAGAGLILQPEQAQEIVRQAKRGIEEWLKNGTKSLPDKMQKAVDATKSKLIKLGVKFKTERELIPVSVKTRIGYSSSVIEDWIQVLLEVEPTNISVHGRTLKQMYTGFANWDEIAKAANAVHKYNKDHKTEITILGNGDVADYKDALAKIKKYHVDGVLIGRASYGNPWVFQKDTHNIEIKDRLQLALEHAKIQSELKPDNAFFQLRKHLAWYVKGIPDAANFRNQLVRVNNYTDVEKIVTEITKFLQMS